MYSVLTNNVTHLVWMDSLTHCIFLFYNYLRIISFGTGGKRPARPGAKSNRGLHHHHNYHQPHLLNYRSHSQAILNNRGLLHHHNYHQPYLFNYRSHSQAILDKRKGPYLPCWIEGGETMARKLLGSSLAGFSIFLPLLLTTTILILLHLPSCYTRDDARSMWKYSHCNVSIAECYEDLEELTSFGDGSASSLYRSKPDYIVYRTFKPIAPVITRPARAPEPGKPDTRSYKRCPGTSYDCGGGGYGL